MWYPSSSLKLILIPLQTLSCVPVVVYSEKPAIYCACVKGVQVTCFIISAEFGRCDHKSYTLTRSRARLIYLAVLDAWDHRESNLR